MPGSGFGKTRRLLAAADYGYVFENAGFKVSHSYYLILARANQLPESRLGLVVSKKNIRLATRRNRIKRVVRETFRQSTPLPQSLDIVFLARRGFDSLAATEQTALMKGAWQKLERKTRKGQ